jgi:hypothetical protein
MQNGVPLNSNQYRNVWDLYRTHPTVGCCVQTIRQCVFGGGLTISGADGATIQHFERIGRSALDWILCVGLIPVIMRSNNSGKILPFLPEPETVNLFVAIDQDGQRKYTATVKCTNGNARFFKEHTTQSQCMVWSGCDFLPTTKGDIITPITHLEATERFLNVMRSNALVASVPQSNPPLVTKSANAKNNDNDGVMWNVDDATVQEADYQKLKISAANTRAEYKLHQESWGTGGGMPTNNTEFENFENRCKTHEYFLSADRDLVRPQEPVVPPNLAEMTRMCDDKICQIFGVPSGMFNNNDSKVQSHYMQVFSLNGNMKLAKKQVERFLQEIWTICNLSQSRTSSKRQKTSSEVHLLGVPCMKQEDIMNMVNHGYLTDTEACNTMRTMIGMPMLDDATIARQVSDRLKLRKIRDEIPHDTRQETNTDPFNEKSDNI